MVLDVAGVVLEEPAAALVPGAVQLHHVAAAAREVAGDDAGGAGPAVHGHGPAGPVAEVVGVVPDPRLPARRRAGGVGAVVRDPHLDHAVRDGVAAAAAVVHAVAVVVGVDVVIVVVAVLPLDHPVVLLGVADGVVAPAVAVAVAAALEERVVVRILGPPRLGVRIGVVVVAVQLLAPAVAVVVVAVAADAAAAFAVDVAVAVVVDPVLVRVGRVRIHEGVAVVAVGPLPHTVVLLTGGDVVVAVAVAVVVLTAPGPVLFVFVVAGPGEDLGVVVVAVQPLAVGVFVEDAVAVVVLRSAVVGAAVQVAAIASVAVGVDAVAVDRLGGARVDVRPAVVAVVVRRAGLAVGAEVGHAVPVRVVGRGVVRAAARDAEGRGRGGALVAGIFVDAAAQDDEQQVAEGTHGACLSGKNPRNWGLGC